MLKTDISRFVRTSFGVLLMATVLSWTAAVHSWALADGDPASDVLLAQSVFYPYDPAVSQSEQRRLNVALQAVDRYRHIALKVALIPTPADLGAIPQLFGKPEEYARYLDTEISFLRPGPVLVVMPNGFGAAGLSAQLNAIVDRQPSPRDRDSTVLAQDSVRAIDDMLRRSSGGNRAESSQPAWIVVTAAGAAATLTVFGWFMWRKARRREPGARIPER